MSNGPSSLTSSPFQQIGEDPLYLNSPGQVPAAFSEFNPAYYGQAIDYLNQGRDQAIGYAENQFGQAAGYQQPFYNNAQGFGQLSSGVLGGDFNVQNDANQFSFDPSDPEYQFLLSQGVDAIDKGASSQGLLNSGSRQQDLTDYGTGLASTYADEVLNRRLAVSQNNFNNLNTLTGYEQNAANNLSGISTGLGTLGANAYLGAGTTGAGIYSGAGNVQNANNQFNAGAANQANQFNAGALSGYQNNLLNATYGGSGGGSGDLIGQLLGQAAGAYVGSL